MNKIDFSYASKLEHSFAQRLIIKVIENLTGKKKLERIYKEFSKNNNDTRYFWSGILESMDIKIINKSKDNLIVPSEGPLLVIANHPFGIIDGLILCSLASKTRSDFKIITHETLKLLPELDKYILPIEFSEKNKASVKNNISTTREAKKHLTCGGEGGMITTNNAYLAQQSRKFAGIGYKHLTANAGETHLARDEVQDPSYARFDTVGFNYRMNDVSAAVGIGQLKRVKEIVNQRKLVGNMFKDNIANKYSWFIPQETPDHIIHAYYTFSCEYKSEFANGKSWKEFYNAFISKGGDGFYGAVLNPYLEPSIIDLFKKDFKEGYFLCPNAEKLQQNVMCFKTNYRDLAKAKVQLDILLDLLDSWV